MWNDHEQNQPKYENLNILENEKKNTIDSVDDSIKRKFFVLIKSNNEHEKKKIKKTNTNYERELLILFT